MRRSGARSSSSPPPPPLPPRVRAAGLRPARCALLPRRFFYPRSTPARSCTGARRCASYACPLRWPSAANALVRQQDPGNGQDACHHDGAHRNGSSASNAAATVSSREQQTGGKGGGEAGSDSGDDYEEILHRSSSWSLQRVHTLLSTRGGVDELGRYPTASLVRTTPRSRRGTFFGTRFDEYARTVAAKRYGVFSLPRPKSCAATLFPGR